MSPETVILGGGPAGASCALWLKQLGYSPLILEKQPRVGGLQAISPYPNLWLAGAGGPSGTAFAATLQQQLEECGVAVEASAEVTALERGGGGFRVRYRRTNRQEFCEVECRFLVAATGVRPRDGGIAPGPGLIFGPGAEIAETDFSGLRVALLGGGDNAFENHGWITAAGAASVTLFARSLRARAALVKAVAAQDLRVGPYSLDPAELTVAGEAFDRIVVLYGRQPNSEVLAGLAPQLDAEGFVKTQLDTAETSIPGLYAIGELARRAHPCCATALADGVTAARAIQDRIEGRETAYTRL
ncbi:MAG: NAD(P)/FAD-dependent oxidoreductase [Limibacillus sp.]